MISKIICVGDSFTAGDELAGDLLIPNYTSYVCKDSEQKYNEIAELYRQKNLH